MGLYWRIPAPRWSGRTALLAGVLLAGGAAACSETPTESPLVVLRSTGNGAPSGAHYNLNIIGVPHDKTADMTGGDGHVIFVQLVGGDTAASLNGKDFNTISKVNKILLTPAPAGDE